MPDRGLRVVRAVAVLAVAAVHLLAGFLWVGGTACLHRQVGRAAAARWCRGLLRLLGVRVEVTGAPRRGALLLSNHLSWLDIVVLYALVPETFLSKEEVRRWPVVGLVAVCLGTLFIGRGRSGAAAQATGAMAGRLARGETVVFFPEGRIAQGQGVLPFRPRLLRAAHDAGVDIQPVAIDYRGHPDGGLGNVVPERSVVLSAWWAAGHPPLATVRFLEPMATAGCSRRELAETARRRIADATGRPVVGRTPLG